MLKHRVAILNSHPIQYFVPLFQRLTRERDIDLTVYFCGRQGGRAYFDQGFGRVIEWGIPLTDGYEARFLPNLRRKDEVAGFLSLINPAIISELWRGRYDAIVIYGYSFATNLFAYAAARCLALPVFYVSESSLTFDANVRRPWHIRALKGPLLKAFFRGVFACLAIGTLSRRHYEHYGVPSDRIFHFPYSVDNEYFERKSAEFCPQRHALRREIGIEPDDVVALFAAKLTTVKHPMLLLEAYRAAIESGTTGLTLLVVGDGPLRAEAETYVARHGLKKVIFAGFANQAEMPKYYAVSDAFVRPDGLYLGDWGLTVNEAMACGLAIVSTPMIGATHDLVKDGENGIVVPFKDSVALTRAFKRLAEDPAAVGRMGDRSREIIRGWGYEQCVEGLKAALESTRRHR